MSGLWWNGSTRWRTDTVTRALDDTHRGEQGRDPMLDPSLAPVIRQLTAGPSERELQGLEPVLAAFRAHVESTSDRPRRRTMFSMLARARLGATLGGVAAGLGGVATVLLVSANVPHGTTPPDAPAQSRPAAVSTSKPGTPQGPDASGPAKHGLCTAWKARAGGPGNSENSVAFTNLAKAAGGANKIAAFCAGVPAPGAKSGSAGQGNGKPTDKPNGKATDKPTDKPTGKPTDKPTDKKTGGEADEPSATPTSTPSSSVTGTPTPSVTPSTGATSSAGS